ncbi:AI-2E family transporter [Rhodocytophaga rosea]|uniref:AI-2E family transporter n=1 Tax=Rhodocytophaga rosea TaxID=2704465 RepID=A0A6C0GHP7_9BACT|nr:AI-2E family transporter [Rhodocytophaga rosea]QHT67230.1 AI-2E family transporter [Rhodocytophaga rosea]
MEKSSLVNNSYFKIALLIITSYFLFAGLYYAQGIIIPLLFAGLLAMLVLPICNFLEKKGINRGLSILLCVLLLILVIGGIVTLFGTQIAQLTKDFPLIKEKALENYHSMQNFIDAKLNIPVEQQGDWIKDNYETFFAGLSGVLSGLLVGISSGLGNFLLVMIYMFFFLLLRERIRNFILQLCHQQDHEMVATVIEKTKRITIKYMTGLLIEIVIYGTLSAIGFAILGIKQGIFFGFLGGILNLIPYLGALIGAVLPMLAAVVYKDSLFYALGVLGVVLVVQFIDNNFITPKVVAGYIRINALATVIVIIIGGALWGIAGMVLFLPLLGILKIIFDNIPSLKPFGYLIGEDKQEASAGVGADYSDWKAKEKAEEKPV